MTKLKSEQKLEEEQKDTALGKNENKRNINEEPDMIKNKKEL